MAEFNGTTLTNKGRDILAKGLKGEKIEFTKILLGDGYTPSGTEEKNMTKLVNLKKTLSILKVEETGDGTVRVRGVYTNKDMGMGFFVREIGLFAKGNDGVEVLYCYTNAGDTADYIPGEGDNIIENVLDIITIIDQAENVTAVISDSIEYITRKDIATSDEVEMGGTDKVVTVDALHDYVDNFVVPINRIEGRYSKRRNGIYASEWEADTTRQLFRSYGDTVVKEAGKFIHDNTTYGGSRGELDSLTINFMEALNRTDRYGTEFFITEYITGNNHSIIVDGQDLCLTTQMGMYIEGDTYSRAAWVKLKEAGTHTIRECEAMTYIDGERITKPTFINDTDWHFVIWNCKTLKGYQNNGCIDGLSGKSIYIALEYSGSGWLPPNFKLTSPAHSIFDSIARDIATATEVEMGGTDKVVTVDALHDYVDNFAWPLNQVNSRYSADIDHARYTTSWDAGRENNLLVPYSHNKVVMEEAGKFIYSNTTYGGTRGELNQVTIDLIEKIYSINKRDKRYGTEFFITKTTQGDGETAPLSVAENNNTYYRTFYRNKNNSTPYSRAFWIKAEEENTVLIIVKGKTYIDGERITKHTVLQDTNWHFVIFNHQNTLGYDYNNLVYMMKGKSCYTALEYVGASYLPPTAVLGAPTPSISDGIHEYVDKFVWPMNRVDGRNCKQVYEIYADEWEAGTKRHLFRARNGGTFEEGGKFIHSNATYGGPNGELNQLTIDLVETCGHNKRYGKEFYITKYTQGTGTAYPQEIDGETYYLSGLSESSASYIAGDRWFFAYWLKAEEANTVLLYPGMYVDGEKITGYTVLEDTDWHFIIYNSSSSTGYTTSFPRLNTKPGKSFYTAMEYAGSGWLPTRTRLKVPAISIYDNNTVDVGLNKSTNGYMKLANGLIYQWGSGTAGLSGSGNGYENIFPIAFPNACFQVTATHLGRDATTTNVVTFAYEKTDFKAFSAHHSNINIKYFAIGY